jgi:hypothetical protein
LTMSSSPGMREGTTAIKHTRNAAHPRVFGNLGRLREGRVRPEKSSRPPVRPLPEQVKTAISPTTYGSHTIAY